MCEEMKEQKITWQELWEFHCQMVTNKSATAVDEKTLFMAESIEEIFAVYGGLSDRKRDIYIKVDSYGCYSYHWEWKGVWAFLNSTEDRNLARMAQTRCFISACSREFTPQEVIDGTTMYYVGRELGDSRYGYLFACLECATK